MGSVHELGPVRTNRLFVEEPIGLLGKSLTGRRFGTGRGPGPLSEGGLVPLDSEFWIEGSVAKKKANPILGLLTPAEGELWKGSLRRNERPLPT